jgi:hypothetical protein
MYQQHPSSFVLLNSSHDLKALTEQEALSLEFFFICFHFLKEHTEQLRFILVEGDHGI